jgi:peptide-N4-(N-acetyl-beta-glucosaminyl)asparagine amidase
MSPSQVVLRLFDGSLGSKWLDFGGGGAGGSAWAEYRLLPGQAPRVVTHYDLVCAEDCAERDPCDWVLEALVSLAAAAAAAAAGEAPSCSTSALALVGASSSSSLQREEAWVVLHRCSGHTFQQRHQLCSFELPPEARVPSSRWRLRITWLRDPAAANSVQLACWNLYSGRCGADSSSSSSSSDATPLSLYLGSGMCEQLRQRATAATAAAAGGDAAVDTLRRIAHNLVQHPDEPKFRRLSGKAAKLRALLAGEPLLEAAVWAIGFRPLFGADGELCLAADGGQGVQAAAQAVLQLLEGQQQG